MYSNKLLLYYITIILYLLLFIIIFYYIWPCLPSRILASTRPSSLMALLQVSLFSSYFTYGYPLFSAYLGVIFGIIFDLFLPYFWLIFDLFVFVRLWAICDGVFPGENMTVSIVYSMCLCSMHIIMYIFELLRIRSMYRGIYSVYVWHSITPTAYTQYLIYNQTLQHSYIYI